MDVNKNVVERYDYYPFGLVSRSSVSSEIETVQKFTGKELDDEHGVELYYFGARYHDPVTGRFISVDPMATKYPGLSPYAYCANNPLILVDPDGRDISFNDQFYTNSNYVEGFNLWLQTSIGNDIYNQLSNNKDIMVHFHTGNSEYNLGLTKFLDKGLTEIARKKGSELSAGMKNNVTVSETKAKAGQQIIVISLDKKFLNSNNSADISKVINHEAQAHVANDPTGVTSRHDDHIKYLGAYSNGEPRPESDPGPNSQAEAYKKQVEKEHDKEGKHTK